MLRTVGVLASTAMITVGLATSSVALYTAQAAAEPVVGSPTSGGNAPALVPPSLRKAVQLALGSTRAAQLTTPDPTWSQQAELTDSDGAPGDQLGWAGNSLSISGTTALVGDCFHTVGSNTGQGAAYVFTESGGAWSEQAELTSADGAPGDDFGCSVSLSGTTALVGAPYHTVGSNTYQGAAYVFTDSGGTWTQEAELAPSDGESYDYFGASVSLSSDAKTAVIGAPREVIFSSYLGKAYIFSNSGGTWVQDVEITPSDGTAMDQFGYSVSLSSGGTTALIGAWGHTVGSNFQQGSAYIFTESGGSWTQEAELTASDGAAGDGFGTSVSLSSDGSRVLVGAGVQGAAYVFTESGGTWTQLAELTASDGAPNDDFGSTVSLSGDGATALVGAPHHTVGSNAEQGAAYLFGDSGGTWSQQAELIASDGAPGDQFGASVSLSGTTALVGAPGHAVGSNTGQGAAYVFSPATVAVNVSGSQTYGSSSPSFTYAPTSVSLTGSLTCATVSGGTTISSTLATGSYTIDGSSCKGLSAPAGYAISYVGVSDGFVVNPAPTSLSIRSVLSGPVLAGSPVAYFASVSKGPVRGTLVGTVSFTEDGTPIAGCSNLHLVLGLALCVARFPNGGSYTIAATYAGDPDFASSTASLTQVDYQRPVITSANHASATLGKHFTFQVAASGYPAPSFSETGALPKGVTFSSSGVLSGTPGSGGFYAITITATNAVGVAHQSFTLTT
jgi:hypothetical protein